MLLKIKRDWLTQVKTFSPRNYGERTHKYFLLVYYIDLSYNSSQKDKERKKVRVNYDFFP